MDVQAWLKTLIPGVLSFRASRAVQITYLAASLIIHGLWSLEHGVWKHAVEVFWSPEGVLLGHLGGSC